MINEQCSVYVNCKMQKHLLLHQCLFWFEMEITRKLSDYAADSVSALLAPGSNTMLPTSGLT